MSTESITAATGQILITGANKGIGLATARAVLEQQPDVSVLLGSRDPLRGQSAIDDLLNEQPNWSERLSLLEIDVASDSSVLAARDILLAGSGENSRPLYGIVNNAGTGFGSTDFAGVIQVNTIGVKRVCEAFMPLLREGGRVVNIASASGPNFVEQCSRDRRRFFQDDTLQWADVEQLIEAALVTEGDAELLDALGLGDGGAYGFSKACVNLYTIILARQHPQFTINACTPGYIETDLTRPTAEARGMTPAEAGMKPPMAGTVAPLFLLFGSPQGSGHYYGSDARRSPLDRYRAPGSPEYRDP